MSKRKATLDLITNNIWEVYLDYKDKKDSYIFSASQGNDNSKKIHSVINFFIKNELKNYDKDLYDNLTQSLNKQEILKKTFLSPRKIAHLLSSEATLELQNIFGYFIFKDAWKKIDNEKYNEIYKNQEIKRTLNNLEEDNVSKNKILNPNKEAKPKEHQKDDENWKKSKEKNYFLTIIFLIFILCVMIIVLFIYKEINNTSNKKDELEVQMKKIETDKNTMDIKITTKDESRINTIINTNNNILNKADSSNPKMKINIISEGKGVIDSVFNTNKLENANL